VNLRSVIPGSWVAAMRGTSSFHAAVVLRAYFRKGLNMRAFFRAREKRISRAAAIAILTLAFSLLSAAGRADVSQSIIGPDGALQRQWDQAVSRLGCSGSLKSGSLQTSGSGGEYRVKNLSDAIRCQSIPNQLTICVMLATGAATYLDMKRTGQHSFGELETAIDNAHGGDPHAFSELSLAETAPANISPDQLALDIYRQCSSYVVAR